MIKKIIALRIESGDGSTVFQPPANKSWLFRSYVVAGEPVTHKISGGSTVKIVESIPGSSGTTEEWAIVDSKFDNASIFVTDDLGLTIEENLSVGEQTDVVAIGVEVDV